MKLVFRQHYGFRFTSNLSTYRPFCCAIVGFCLILSASYRWIHGPLFRHYRIIMPINFFAFFLRHSRSWLLHNRHTSSNVGFFDMNQAKESFSNPIPVGRCYMLFGLCPDSFNQFIQIFLYLVSAQKLCPETFSLNFVWNRLSNLVKSGIWNS